jgi:hypothetical protein
MCESRSCAVLGGGGGVAGAGGRGVGGARPVLYNT